MAIGRPGNIVFGTPSARFLQMLEKRPEVDFRRGRPYPTYMSGGKAGQPYPPYMDATQLSAIEAQKKAQTPFVSPLLRRAMSTYIPPSAQTPSAPTPTATPMQNLMRQPLTSPAGMGIMSAALTGLDASGPQPVPTSTGQILARAGMAGLQTFAKAKQVEAAAEQAKFDREYKSADLQIKLAKLQNQGPFAGTSMTAQSMNTLLSLSPKMEAGNADPQEEQLYRLAYGYLSKPRVETRETDQGTTTVRVPGQDMSAFHRPEGFAADEEVIGQTSAKFTEGQSNAAAFANRMIASLDIFDELTGAGYDPTNFRDYAAGNLPGAISGYATSAQGQSYLAAKEDFITAVLRQESGAAISFSEFRKEDRKYFPQPGEGPEVIEQKRIARQRALESMKAQSGPAYEVLFGEAEETGIPPGSQFIKRVGDTSYYKDPNGDIIAVDD